MNQILSVLNEENIKTRSLTFDLQESSIIFVNFMFNQPQINEKDKKSVLLLIEKTQQLIL